MIDLEFNFSNVAPELAADIQTAITNGIPFGLTNGRVLNVFVPKELKGSFVGRHYRPPVYFNYNNEEAMLKGVSLALLSCKEIVLSHLLTGQIRAKGLDIQKLLGKPNA